MNNDEPPGILSVKRCTICGRLLCSERRTRTCSPGCRLILAEFEEINELRLILSLSRWAGAPSQEEALEDYLRRRMWEAVRRLPHSAEVLAEVLVEIAELLAEEETEGEQR